MTRKNPVEVKRGPAPEGSPSNGRVEMPLADIIELPGSYVLTLDIPGATKESISVTLERQALEIRASVDPGRVRRGDLLYSEIRTSGYARTFTIGEGIDRDNVDARYENGVLMVTLKKSEAIAPREIRIH